MPTKLRPFRSAEPDAISEGAGRRIVRQRSGGLCEIAIDGICLGRAAGVHHRVKSGQGGSWRPSNLLDACGSGTVGCHGWVEAHPAAALELGLGLRSYMDPLAASAVMRWANQRSRWYLTDDGSLVWDDTWEAGFADILYAGGADTQPPVPWFEV